ncbi:hypothetical protein AX16_008696 [Volvariella volvacea WC 439]|nr:hypothetical protein AX16_008696 [Volvariella volvacea WC 439]
MDNLDESSWVKAERARIDQEILQLEEQLRDLRLRRNALAPISQLPPEILSRIMTAYQRGIFNKQQRKVKKGEFFSPRSLSWISITQVSSHWRDVALQCPTLWNVISLPTMRREWAELLFLRSKGAPVSLTVQSPTVGGEYWLGILPSLERSLDRITSLLIFGDLQTRKHLSPLDFSRSPLKSFTAIWCSGWLYHSCSTVVGLGHVRMENSYLDMAFISQDLVTLEIKLPDTSGMPTLQVFYDTLSTLTRLSHLTLDNVFSRCSETTTDKSQITMPSLVSLTLVNDTEHRYAHFLSRLVPPQGMVHLTVSLSKPPTALTKLSAILPEFISNTSLPIASSSSVFYILGNQGTRRVTIRALDSLNEDVISVSWIRDDMLETLSIAEFVSQLPLKTPRDLKLTISAPKILQELSSPTSMLADLETLTLSNSKALADAIPSCECVRGANTMLSEAESHNDHSDPAPLRGCPMCQEFSASIFPDVRTLRFEQIKFDEQNFGLSSLIRFVAHRRDCGRPLTEVVIKCDAMSIAPEFQNRLERLRKIVDIVIYVGGALYKWDKEE